MDGDRPVDGRKGGRLLRAPRGEGGYDYDPIFLGDGQSRTNAELFPAEKEAICHRGKAFRALSKVIAKFCPGRQPDGVLAGAVSPGRPEDRLWRS